MKELNIKLDVQFQRLPTQEVHFVDPITYPKNVERKVGDGWAAQRTSPSALFR